MAQHDAGSETRRSAADNAPSALGVFADRRTIIMLALGFSAGLPFLLIFDTLSAWLRESGLSLEVIGFFSLVTMIYSFKFLWAPLVDRGSVPLLTAWLGHRRSWMLVCQVAIMIGLWLVAGTSPASNLSALAAFAVIVGIASATQDIAMDAWRIEVAESTRQGAMAAAYRWGYQTATLVAGALPLLLADSYGWHVSYATMATLMGIGMIAVFAAPAEAAHTVRPIDAEGLPHTRWLEWFEWAARLTILVAGALLLGSGLTANARALGQALRAIGADTVAAAALTAWTSTAQVWVHLASVIAGFSVILLSAVPLPGIPTRPGRFLSMALGEPLRDFFIRHRRSSGLILALICVYRIPDFVINIMNPFYLDLGFTLVEIAEVRKIFGVAATMAGVLGGGYAVARVGVVSALLIGAVAGSLSNLAFSWLAVQGHSLPALFVAIGVENVANGFAGTCLIAYMSGLTSAGFTATQYALLSSLYAIPARIIASQSGRIVEAAAKAADGGALPTVRSLFSTLPPDSYSGAMERSGVSPVALASGYLVFFGYSAAIGLFAIVLAFAVWRRERAGASEPLADPQPAATPSR